VAKVSFTLLGSGASLFVFTFGSPVREFVLRGSPQRNAEPRTPNPEPRTRNPELNLNTNGERRRQKRERQFILGVVAAGVLAAVPASTQDRAGACQELVLYNGTIATMDARNTMTRSVTIRADRIAAVGTARDIPTHDACATLIDLRGRTVIPGLIDSHNHIVPLSLRRGHDVRGVESAFSIPELQQVTRARASTLPAGEWMTAVGGWAPNQFVERRLPTMAELDAAAPNHPVYLQTGFAGPAVTNSTGKAFFGQHGVAVRSDGSIGAIAPTVAAWNALKSMQTDADRKRGALEVMMYAARVG
jgi:hypothetical protein